MLVYRHSPNFLYYVLGAGAIGGLKMKDKDKKIIEDSERVGIPIFVLTAKDNCSVVALVEYFKQVTLEGCSQEHKLGVMKRIDDFREWQINNLERVKMPD